MARGVTATAIADSVLRLAVLLQAGVAPSRAWAYLAAAGDEHAVRVCAASATGMPLPAAIARTDAAPVPRRRLSLHPADAGSATTSWRDVGAAWQVATAVGAPLAESLRALSVALRDAQEAADDVRVALAEPAATARLMAWLPLVAVLLGIALGFDTFGTLIGSPLGIACLLLGAALIFAAQRWNAALGEATRAGGGIPGLDAELLAIALSGGVSIDRARRLVHRRHGLGDGCRDRRGARLSRAAQACPRSSCCAHRRRSRGTVHASTDGCERHGSRRGCCCRWGSAPSPRSCCSGSRRCS